MYLHRNAVLFRFNAHGVQLHFRMAVHALVGQCFHGFEGNAQLSPFSLLGNKASLALLVPEEHEEAIQTH